LKPISLKSILPSALQIWHLHVFAGMAYWYRECASTYFAADAAACVGADGSAINLSSSASANLMDGGGDIQKRVDNISSFLFSSTIAIWQSIVH
jgi:hypothetical protein